MDINQQAIADRGWGPLNRKLLEHSSLCHHNDTFSHSSQTLSGLNIENADGMAASVLDRIVRERVKNKSAKEAAEKRLADGNNIRKNIKDAKRVSAGVLAKNGVFALDSAEFIEGLKQRHDKEQALKTEKEKKKQKIVSTNAKKVKAARQKNGHESIHKFKKFSMEECAAYLQYKRVAKDPAMPKNISGRRTRCLEVMQRDSPFVSPHNSDEEDDIPNIRLRDKAEHVVVEALMGMGQGLPKDDISMEGDDEGKEDDKRERDEWEMSI